MYDQLLIHIIRKNEGGDTFFELITSFVALGNLLNSQ